MPAVYRACKARHGVFDGTGASLSGGRWNSPGRPVIYASTCLAGSLMEIIVRAGARAKLPDAHHCARAWVPEGLSIEDLDPSDLPGWDSPDLAASRAFGDAWLEEQRSVIAYVPAVTAKPLGRHALINPLHLDFANITIEPTIPVTWDARLFAL